MKNNNIAKNYEFLKDCIKIIPPNIGWLQKKLSKDEISYLWGVIDNQKESVKHKLVGVLTESNALVDTDNWFFNNTVLPMCNIYANEFGNLGKNLPINQQHPYCLESFWVNYQYENQFNPNHSHIGVYSFVIWLKIPTSHHDQNKIAIATSSSSSGQISTFQLMYINTLGDIKEYIYEMNPEIEGTMLLFPSRMMHSVNPYYNCIDSRISISGNVSLNSASSTKVPPR